MHEPQPRQHLRQHPLWWVMIELYVLQVVETAAASVALTAIWLAHPSKAGKVELAFRVPLHMGSWLECY